MAQSTDQRAVFSSVQPACGNTFGRQTSSRQADLARVDWRGRRVTVMGLGRHGGGLGAVRYLAGQGASVTVSDAADARSLANSIEQLADVPIESFHLGGHDELDFRSAEFVVVNPAVRPNHACLELARTAGARLTTEMELFLARCPARVIGVTGTTGKTTTAAMLASILTAAGRCTWLGGNIGGSLLADLDQMTADDWVVCELSSFQLAHLDSCGRWPQVAMITNCTPHHLDWHGGFDGYTSAKRRLYVAQRPGGVNVVNVHSATTAAWAADGCNRAFESWPLTCIPRLQVPGEHNRQNAACAAAAAEVAGVDRGTIVETLGAFSGLAHRIEPIGEFGGRRFYNDAKSTSPAATIAALEAISGPIWLLAGGCAVGADFSPLVSRIVERAAGAAVFGGSRYALCGGILDERADFNVVAVERLADALAWCWRQSRAGDAIVLSPAAASFDQFGDYRQRGETFRALVRALVDGASSA